MSVVKVIICGAKGRMGRTLITCAQGDPELQLVGEIDQDDDLSKFISQTDVLIDFSVREATTQGREAGRRAQEGLGYWHHAAITAMTKRRLIRGCDEHNSCRMVGKL